MNDNITIETLRELHKQRPAGDKLVIHNPKNKLCWSFIWRWTSPTLATRFENIEALALLENRLYVDNHTTPFIMPKGAIFITESDARIIWERIRSSD